VTDEWLKNLPVEKLADGDIPHDDDVLKYAAAMQTSPIANCCVNKRK
jgi:hypothetical protein